jgi:hypothetical protein
MNINRVLGYLAVASAVLAFLLWAVPNNCFSFNGRYCGWIWDDSRLWFNIYSGGQFNASAQWVLIFALVSLFLLIARAGNRR